MYNEAWLKMAVSHRIFLLFFSLSTFIHSVQANTQQLFIHIMYGGGFGRAGCTIHRNEGFITLTVVE